MIMIIKLIVITIIMIIINDININNIYIYIYFLFCGLLCEITHIYILPIPPIPSKVDMQWDMRQFFDPSSTKLHGCGCQSSLGEF